MLDPHTFSANLALAYFAYLIGVASPGPSNLAIMGTAMAHGRKHALALTAGVVCGSLLWGTLAAFGMASLMRSYSSTLVIVKVLGGAYLLWLAWKAAKTAYLAKPFDDNPTTTEAHSYRRSFAKGATLHITNPKAIFVWLSIVSLALPQNARTSDAMVVVAGCGLIGAAVFTTYAIAFSTLAVRRAYQAIHRWFNATLSCVFAYAGIRLLLSHQSR